MSDTGVVIGICSAVGLAGSAAIGHLWKHLRESDRNTHKLFAEYRKETTAQLNRYEDSRLEMENQMFHLHHEVGELKGRENANKVVARELNMMRELHETMLDEIRATNNDQPPEDS